MRVDDAQPLAELTGDLGKGTGMSQGQCLADSVEEQWELQQYFPFYLFLQLYPLVSAQMLSRAS